MFEIKTKGWYLPNRPYGVVIEVKSKPVVDLNYYIDDIIHQNKLKELKDIIRKLYSLRINPMKL